MDISNIMSFLDNQIFYYYGFLVCLFGGAFLILFLFKVFSAMSLDLVNLIDKKRKNRK